ncbi:MAG: hypothetical protein V3W28_06095 [Thermoplasmata archaeon]
MPETKKGQAQDLSKMEDPQEMTEAGTQAKPSAEQPKQLPPATKPPEIPPEQPSQKPIPEPPIPFEGSGIKVAKDKHKFKREERVKIFAPGFDIDGLYGMIASNSFVKRKVECQDGQDRTYQVWDVELDTRIEGLFQLPARMLIPVTKYDAILR